MKPLPWKAVIRGLAAAIALAGAQPAMAQSFSSGSTGADGPLSKTTFGNTDITVRAGGVYHHTTVSITAGGLRYFRGTDNSPVVILATGDVTIGANTILSVNGNDGAASIGSNPTIGASGGPGGFNGGNGGVLGLNAVPGTAGHGPAGGAPAPFSGTAPATYGAPTSFVALTPLFGGWGGGGGNGGASGQSSAPGSSGGGGGGAILIASSTRVIINGSIRANGGALGGASLSVVQCSSAGAGGAIRVVAPEIIGTGNLQAIRGGGTCSGVLQAGDGRIRVEAFATQGFTGTTAPVASVSNVPGAVSPAGNPALENVPTLAIASVGGIPVPSTIAASYFAPDMALAPGTTNPVPVVINATNTPVGAPTSIALRSIPQSPGTASLTTASDHTGTFASSSATINATLAVGQVTVLQAIAGMTLTGQTASLFPQIDGEPVERVLLAASPGEASTLSLVTKSGREVRVDQLRAEQQQQVARAWQILKETHVE
jgi:hypothetical protein